MEWNVPPGGCLIYPPAGQPPGAEAGGVNGWDRGQGNMGHMKNMVDTSM